MKILSKLWRRAEEQNQDPEKNNIFTGEFLTGKASLKLGLIDGIGNADQVFKEKFGEKVIIKTFEKPKDLLHENYPLLFKILLKNLQI